MAGREQGELAKSRLRFQFPTLTSGKDGRTLHRSQEGRCWIDRSTLTEPCRAKQFGLNSFFPAWVRWYMRRVIRLNEICLAA
jgi:hypothetical protein